jgi:hypothetical protein
MKGRFLFVDSCLSVKRVIWFEKVRQLATNDIQGRVNIRVSNANKLFL